MDVPARFEQAVGVFDRGVRQVGPDQWGLATPATEWDVRALVNHVTAEALWVPPLLHGMTIAEVGDRFDGDVLGDDPRAVWEAAAAEAVAAMREEGAMLRTVGLSSGETPAEEYAWQMLTDHLVHGWDLAVSIGADDTLPPDVVEACIAWFASMEEFYREAGAIGQRADIPHGATPQAVLLAMFGRTADWRPPPTP